MKNKYLGLVMATAVLTTTGVSTVQAAESATDVQTNAKVEFTANETGETPPTNPENPSEPITPPEGGGESGGKGALRIDWASNFDFGKNEISNNGKDLALPALRKGDQKLQHFVQVSDLRGEDNPDWTLSVKASELKKDSETRTDASKITGSSIQFVKAPIQGIGGGVPEVTPVWKTEEIMLDGSQQTLISAKGEGARGTWSMGMSGKNNQVVEKDDSINLVIPQREIGKIRKGAYTASLDWNLSASVVDAGFMAPKIK